MFETRVREGVLRLRRPGTRWLSTGPSGGRHDGPVAYNVSVPDGWERTDLETYVAERRRVAGFEPAGPTLLTGVDLEHARGARCGPVEAVVTAGVSNPAALPMEPSGEASVDEARGETGTVNVLLGTERALPAGAFANLVAIAAEAKAATLLAEVGVPGTTTDAVVVACDPAGERREFTGSATEVGAAARACVREAVAASLESRYADRERPTSVAGAEYGIETTERAEVFVP
ncbi:adenosylcobinamide amidohydrolase [Halalkalicoccus ordinarius]|uniref:adenosylcobinamide amidohydrolase n=1 Tax=Halalkalicoccus ordinarius TaxID=3116651 RepID=UPI00300EC9D1